jgi:hypothetical protein
MRRNSSTISEDLPRRFQLYFQDLPMCDCCIVMSTSLAVYPFADIVDCTTRSTPRILINRQLVGTFLLARPYDVTMIGDLKMNVKEFLIKLDVIDKVMELMKKENEEKEKNKTVQNKNRRTTSSTITDDRFKAAEIFIEQRRKFSPFNYYRQEQRSVPQPKIVFNESTKVMIEQHNNALLFNRRRSKKSSSSSSSSSDSLNSSLSESELMPFAFKRSSEIQSQPSKKMIPTTTATQVTGNSLLNAAFKTVL